MLQLSKYNEVIETSFMELAPHKICQYVYELANAFNRFYHDTKIIAEENEKTACFLAQSDQSGEGCRLPPVSICLELRLPERM